MLYPPHIIEDLRSEGCSGQPEDWFKEKHLLSNNTEAVIFLKALVYCVDRDGEWTRTSLAQLASTPKDCKMLMGTSVNFESVRSIKYTAWLFPDGSIQYPQGATLIYTQLTDGSTHKILKQWFVALEKKEQSLLTRFLRLSSSYKAIREALITWLDFLEEHVSYTK